MAGLSGYDFKLYRWGELRGSHPALVEQIRYDHTFTVPDEMWVMRHFESVAYARKCEILGSPEALNLGTSYSKYERETLYFSPKPFVMIQVIYGGDPDADWRSYVAYGAYLHRAQQVHKGQLGQYVPIELPLVAREAPSKVSPWTKPRDRKRGYIGWVRLAEAAEMAKMSPAEFVLDHWLFVEARDRSYYVDPYKEVRIEMIRARDRETIHKQVVNRSRLLSCNRAEFEAMAADSSTLWYEYWIRRGFARTVLLLQQFGWNTYKQRQLLRELQRA